MQDQGHLPWCLKEGGEGRTSGLLTPKVSTPPRFLRDPVASPRTQTRAEGKHGFLEPRKLQNDSSQASYARPLCTEQHRP